VLIVYADLACPHCAAAWSEIRERPVRLVFRHFPVASKHPRAPALHAAAEAAGMQGCFFEMVDSLYEDRGRVDDPHLWERAEALGLDLERFEAERRSDEVAARVRRDFESGIRGGVVGTPAMYSPS
jgi:protein-disulfide isomerase